MNASTTTDRPRLGDLVLTLDDHGWNLSVHPGPAQMRAADLNAAIGQAGPLAEHGHVDLWSTRDGAMFTRQPWHAPRTRGATG